MVDKLYLVRHAEAEGNLYRRIHGWYDSRLTETGIRQVEALKGLMSGEDINLVFSSDLRRTMHTASALPVDPSRIAKTPQLRELNMGSWEDGTWGDLLPKLDGSLREFNENPDFTKYGGENLSQLARRTGQALSDIITNYSGNVAVVSHAFALRTMLSSLLDKPVADCRIPANASLSLFEREGEKDFKPVFFNEIKHLKGIESFKARCPEGYEQHDPNLRFRPAGGEEDIRLGVDYWEDAWHTINGYKLGFDRCVAESEIRRMLRFNSDSMKFAMLGNTNAGILILDTANLIDEDCGHISLIALKKEFRGCGFAVQLLGEAVSFYRRLGRDRLRLRVAAKNEPALKLYRRYGFEQSEESFDSDGKQYIMKKHIAL